MHTSREASKRIRRAIAEYSYKVTLFGSWTQRISWGQTHQSVYFPAEGYRLYSLFNFQGVCELLSGKLISSWTSCYKKHLLFIWPRLLFLASWQDNVLYRRGSQHSSIKLASSHIQLFRIHAFLQNLCRDQAQFYDWSSGPDPPLLAYQFWSSLQSTDPGSC